jgi:peptidoglycan lytic transglycosylase
MHFRLALVMTFPLRICIHIRSVGGAPVVSRCPILAIAAVTAILIDAHAGYAASGIASWYGAWHDGKPMANGCPFHAGAISAASPVLPIGAWLKVRNLRNGRVILVRVLDRGPYISGRVLDLSEAAARQLGMHESGLAPVSIEVLSVEPIFCH